MCIRDRDDLERQNRDFLWISGAISGFDTKSFTRRCHGTILYALRYDCNEGVLFCPKFLRCTISMYCECNNLLFSTFLMHSIWWNGLHRPILQRNLWYFVRWCCHLGNQFTTPSLVLGVVKHLYYSHAQVHTTLSDCTDWVVIFLRAKAATALSSHLSHHDSVRPSVSLSICPSDRHMGGTR